MHSTSPSPDAKETIVSEVFELAHSSSFFASFLHKPLKQHQWHNTWVDIQWQPITKYGTAAWRNSRKVSYLNNHIRVYKNYCVTNPSSRWKTIILQMDKKLHGCNKPNTQRRFLVPENNARKSLKVNVGDRVVFCICQTYEKSMKVYSFWLHIHTKHHKKT